MINLSAILDFSYSVRQPPPLQPLDTRILITAERFLIKLKVVLFVSQEQRRLGLPIFAHPRANIIAEEI